MPNEESILISRAQNGDVKSFEALIWDYQPRLFRLVAAVAGNLEDAEDALQETFLQAYRALPGFRGDSSFSTWLYRIALNATRNWMRSQIRASSERIAKKMVQVGTETPPAVDEDLLEQEKQEMLRQALIKLPDHYRQVFLLRHYQDLSYEQIAQVLSIPTGTVRSRLAQGRQLILKELDAFGYLVDVDRGTKR